MQVTVQWHMAMLHDASDTASRSLKIHKQVHAVRPGEMPVRLYTTMMSVTCHHRGTIYHEAPESLNQKAREPLNKPACYDSWEHGCVVFLSQPDILVAFCSNTLSSKC